MDIITQTLVRVLKEMKIYKQLKKSEYKDLYFNSLIKTINPVMFFNTIYNIDKIACLAIFNRIFNICKYEELMYSFCDINIIDIKDYDRFKKFLNDNGIVWINNKLFSDEDIIRFKNMEVDLINREKLYFYIPLRSDCKLYYGKSSTNIPFKNPSRILLTEEEFYDYYTRARNEVCKNFNRFIYFNALNNKLNLNLF